jgi:2-polyprenyl-6-methoxyphenol hydroxylase-like FAD-dependent oxidoreductase
VPDVLVVGAGPTGLMTAVELQRAGVDALVLDREPRHWSSSPTRPRSKALGLQPRSVELLDARGLLEPLLPHVRAHLPHGHFSGIALDYRALPTRFPYQLGVEQARVEDVLEDHLRVPVLRGSEVVAVAQDDDSVTVRLADGRSISAGYAVAADGGHSAVRSLLGAAFPGRSAAYWLVVSDITLAGRPAGVADEWALPEFGAAPLGYLLPLGGGRFRFLFGGAEQQELDRSAPVTAAEVQRALTAAHGPEAEVGEVLWASRFGDASRQLADYRHGRVLFAGDAAHVHLPVGGQGLNLGLQDAVNLGWKLAAQVRGWAPPGLLDSYHDERHPVAARVLLSTRAQAVLTVPEPDVLAVRTVLTDLVGVPDAQHLLAMEISGLGVRYGTDPRLGGRAADVALPADGRGVLIGGGAASWSDRVVTVDGPSPLLVRPDGHVGWSGGPGLEDALRRWFGEPARVAVGGPR